MSSYAIIKSHKQDKMMNEVTIFYGVYDEYFDTEADAEEYKKEADLTRAVNDYIDESCDKSFSYDYVDLKNMKEFLKGLIELIPDGYLGGD